VSNKYTLSSPPVLFITSTYYYYYLVQENYVNVLSLLNKYIYSYEKLIKENEVSIWYYLNWLLKYYYYYYGLKRMIRVWRRRVSGKREEIEVMNGEWKKRKKGELTVWLCKPLC